MKASNMMRCSFAPRLVRHCLVALGMLVFATTAHAQQATSPFNLSATRDFAVTGMRSATGFRFWVSNAGFMDAQQGIEAVSPAALVKGGATNVMLSEVSLWATAGRTDYARNRARYAALANVRNVATGGHTVSVNNHSVTSATDWLPADGSLGIHFSGARTPGTGQTFPACQSHTKDAIPPAFTLMAGSDCTPTWGANGFQARGNVAQGTYLAALAQGGNAFTFDFWKYPVQTGIIGNNFQTYGFISDYNVSNNVDYGSVIPGGTGTPKVDGYPLGLDWQFDAFNFKDARYAGVVFYQATVTNRTKEHYGVGMDYDSLYAGFVVRPSSAFTRAGFWTEQNAVMFNELRSRRDCDQARPLPERLTITNFVGTCASITDVSGGFARGAMSFMVLKSPIGDTRNKLLSDPVSPFLRPGHPLAGDTITFNVARNCGQECSTARILSGRSRSAWGVLTSHDADALSGDSPAGLPPNDYWFLFHPQNAAAYGEGPRVDINNPRAGGGFNYCVPGMGGVGGSTTWTYRSARPQGAPLGADTLFYDDCSPVTNALAPFWADTFPDRSLKLLRGSEYIGAGPFRLAAGETQSFVVAVVLALDSTTIQNAVRDVNDLYKTFYAAPQPPPTPKVVAVDIDGGSVQNTNVRITLDLSSQIYVDEFLLIRATQLRTAAPNTPDGRLNRLNPWLADSLTKRAGNNIRRILVYKSCNPSASTLTYTTARNINGICSNDQVRDTLNNSLGPAAYSAIATGTTIFSDGNVLAGQSYLYAFVPETFGARFTVTDSAATGFFTREIIFEDKIASLPSSKAASNVVTVYIPASYQAGGAIENLQFKEERFGTTLDTIRIAGLPDRIVSWNNISADITSPISTSTDLREIFGDQAIIDVFRLAPGATADSSRVRLVRSRTTGYTITGVGLTARATPIRAVTDTLRFSGPGDLTVALRATATTSINALASGQLVAPFVVPGPVAVVIDDRTKQVLFVSNSFNGLLFTPGLFAGRSNYFPVRLGVDTSAISNPTNKGFIGRVNFDQNGVRVAPNFVFSPLSLDWLQGSTQPTGAGNGGEYLVKMTASEFGTDATFTLDQGPTAISTQLAGFLAARAVGTTGATDAATATVIAKYLNKPITTDSLLAVKLPFTITNKSFGTNVRIAMLKSDKAATYRLGIAPDTLRIDVPQDQWLPGDRLILIEDVPVGAGTESVVSFYPVVLGCATQITCNPVRGTGGDATYGATPAGYTISARYTIPARAPREIVLTITPTIALDKITEITQAQIDSVKVVPNPYIVYSAYEQQAQGSRIMFTHLPPVGKIQIFTVSGQFVQELTWDEGQLQNFGDLYFDMRSREGTEMGSGVYLYVVTAKDPGSGKSLKKVGRFIIVR